MRMKMRVLILVGLAIVLAAPVAPLAAAPADVDGGPEWSEVFAFDRIQQLLSVWFGGDGPAADAEAGPGEEVRDPGFRSTHAANEDPGDGDGPPNGGPHWDPNGNG